MTKPLKISLHADGSPFRHGLEPDALRELHHGAGLPTAAEVGSALPKDEGWTVVQGYRRGCFGLVYGGRTVGELRTVDPLGELERGWAANLFGGKAVAVWQSDFRWALFALFGEPVWTSEEEGKMK